jgi:phosphoribosylaminoimidazolecarboxamide formyltransferase/IMP cyclohydrolase
MAHSSPLPGSQLRIAKPLVFCRRCRLLLSSRAIFQKDVMSQLVTIKRALVSVSDKSGLADFAAALSREFGVELISTGGTAKFLREAGLEVTDVSAITGFPEMMDGRVKTLHPKVHGGLLALRDNESHVEAMRKHDIHAIDLVIINLYPFRQTIAKPNVSFEEAIENIDIGGPSMVRSASKNHRFVLVVTSPGDYSEVLAQLRESKGATDYPLRLRFAQKAFAHTAEYDATIASYLARQAKLEQDQIIISLKKKQTLRYGENPHQPAGLYVGAQPREASVAFAQQHHGKELSYINLLDADAALLAVKEFAAPSACIVKHATPCGFAVADDLKTAFEKAYAGDPKAAFGGIIALNKRIDLATAQAMTSAEGGKWFLEVIVAPSYDPEALELLRSRWKNVRILEVGEVRTVADADPDELHLHKIVGGYLVQSRDLAGSDTSAWKVVSKRQPTEQEMRSLRVAWIACKHIKSNGIAVVRDDMMVGSGAGQQERMTPCRLATEKAGERSRGAVAASDAFFPFPDGPRFLLDAGITAIIHPGGSIRDQETIDLVNERGAVLIFTGERHFRH